MDFRFRRWNENYHAKIFLQEICNAVRPIEVLQTLNYMEIFMSLNGQLTHQKTGAALPEDLKDDDESESIELEGIELQGVRNSQLKNNKNFDNIDKAYQSNGQHNTNANS